MKEYAVTINGVEHTMQLDDADADRYGEAAKAVSTKQSAAPKNKGA